MKKIHTHTPLLAMLLGLHLLTSFGLGMEKEREKQQHTHGRPSVHQRRCAMCYTRVCVRIDQFVARFSFLYSLCETNLQIFAQASAIGATNPFKL